MRGQIKRLEHAARSGLDSFVLESGDRFYYDPASMELIKHIFSCLSAQGAGEPFPEPPPVVRAIAAAKDRRSALEQVAGGGGAGLFPYQVEALVEHGRITPRSLVSGYELGDTIPDLSE